MSDEDDVLAELETILADAHAAYDSEKAQRELIDAEVDKLRKLMDEQLQAKRALDSAKLERLRVIRRHEQALSDAKRAKAIAEENARLAKLAEDRISRIREQSSTMPWAMRALPHQFEGAAMLSAAQRAICADSMGLGKTLQAFMYCDMVQAKRVLIFCPGDVIQGFENEARNWAPHRAVFPVGKKSKDEQRIIFDMVRDEPEFTVIINYESWNRNRAVLQELVNMTFDTVIVDEAHTVKEVKGVPYKGVEAVVLGQNSCPKCGCYKAPDTYYCPNGHDDYVRAPSVKNLLMMTGTPILNSPKDIYPLLHLLNPELFPYENYFKRDFTRTDYDGKLVWNAGGEARLQQRLSGMYIRRTREQAGIKLPPQDIIVHELELDPEEYKLQADILKQLAEDASIKVTEGHVTKMMELLALITRNRQAATWPGGITIEEPVFNDWGMPEFDKNGDQKFVKVNVGENYRESIKMDKACELLDELISDGHRVVVFSQFKTALQELQRRRGDRSIEFHGDTPQDVRDAIKRNFDRSYKEEPKWDSVLCNFRTGGVGLNLTAATAVIILDEEWNGGKNDQAYDRINRMGQTEDTQVHILRLAHSIDTWMAKLIERKRHLVGNFDDAKSIDTLEEAIRKMLLGKGDDGE